MGYYICMEDLVSNAFIAVGKQNKRFLSYTVLEQYGNAVAQALERKKFKSVFRLSRFYKSMPIIFSRPKKKVKKVFA